VANRFFSVRAAMADARIAFLSPFFFPLSLSLSLSLFVLFGLLFVAVIAAALSKIAPHRKLSLRGSQLA
jgi:hypothetical protein